MGSGIGLICSPFGASWRAAPATFHNPPCVMKSNPGATEAEPLNATTLAEIKGVGFPVSPKHGRHEAKNAATC